MLQVFLIGHLGANAETIDADGNRFVKFRVAHTERWTDTNGVNQSRTTWVDCTMNYVNGHAPAVLPYLSSGTMVFVQGSVSLRVYSSAKDRCMKAGLTIRVSSLNLLGGRGDAVPKQVFTMDGAVCLDVQKCYYVGDGLPFGVTQLVDKSGALYDVTSQGWVYPHVENAETEVQSKQFETDAPNGKKSKKGAS